MDSSKPVITATQQPETWQEILQSCFTQADQFLSYLKITHQVPDKLAGATKNFPLRVPLPFAQRIEKGNINDPLLLQILPQLAELDHATGFTDDPLNEYTFTPRQGLLHKYHGRVLMITTSSCAIHCRYCFRRHFPYDSHRQSKQQWSSNFDYIREDHTINEVILSGGDPLNCSDEHLQWITGELEKIQHIKRLRIHTRMPTVIPQRIDSGLINWLTQTNLKVVIVLHCNHANEIDDQVARALAKLSDIKIPLLNQSVLLANINDNSKVLIALSEQLFDCGVQPYYLHVLDKVAGAAHFDLENNTIVQLYKELVENLPGYLVPKLVREIAGAPAKVPVMPPSW